MRGLARDLSVRPATVDEFTTDFCTAARDAGQKKAGFLSTIFGRS